MEKGNCIFVYEDILEEEELEGKARLIAKVKGPSPVTGMETWTVKFLRDNQDNLLKPGEPTVTRQVHKRNLTI